VTFTEIVDAVKERTNLTSTEATARIGRNVNDRYRRLTSSVGINTSRRGTDTQNTVVDNPRLTFALEKIEVVYTVVSGKRRIIPERTFDEWRVANTEVEGSGDPQWYAVELSGAATVGIVLHPTPSAIEAWKADGLAPATTLSGANVPAFPADFHDALIYGAMASEYFKLQNNALAIAFEKQYEERMA
jgi:hypothetical protein